MGASEGIELFVCLKSSSRRQVVERADVLLREGKQRSGNLFPGTVFDSLGEKRIVLS